MSDQPEPVFPPEIEEIIFSLCAQSNLPESGNLILVAKRVYQWLRPQLYEVVVFNTSWPHRRPSFKSDLLEVHSHHVRHILFWSGECVEKLDTCLSWCPNVIDVALWSAETHYSSALINQLLSLHITHLSFDISTFHWGVTENCTPDEVSFRSVTHLDLVGSEITLKANQIKTYFPSVTHIAFNGRRGLPTRDVLDCWESQLEVLIWYLHRSRYDNTAHNLPNDPRIVVMGQDRDYVNEWIEATKDTPESVWRMAEVAVERRRRGV
ncbi:hypothetical protein BDN72DRAFT_840354 [Pluteus cervinus]|uniref:Uncharacterized protein n=1 Tax=Pluteus cervinus TaxID=181527 RepID=A0ACD3AU66_9AGAR|nr:hypothetical protein BDN72DRAFT_840354 [Pluteus cervinus]